MEVCTRESVKQGEGEDGKELWRSSGEEEEGGLNLSMPSKFVDVARNV